MFDEEEGDSEQDDGGEETSPPQRVNRRIIEERQPMGSVGKSGTKKRSKETKGNEYALPTTVSVDLQSQPEFQILLKELREVKEQLKEHQSRSQSEQGESEKLNSLPEEGNVGGIPERNNFMRDKETGKIIKSPSTTTINLRARS